MSEESAEEQREWRHYALCLEEDPELFFPIGDSKEAIQQTEDAKSVCHRPCPVIEDCLRWALKSGQAGIVGGLTQDERRYLQRSLKKGEEPTSLQLRASIFKAKP